MLLSLPRRSMDVRASIWILGLLLAVLVITPGRASAHPDLDRGIARAGEAEFDAALTAFAQALESGTLTREELVVLLSERALVLHALGKTAALEKDLDALAMLAPERAFDRRAPPELVNALAKTKAKREAPLSLEARCELRDDGFRVSAKAIGAEQAESAHVRIYSRGDDEVRFTISEASETIHTPETGSKLAYYVELVGFGGVVLASAGSLENPRICGSDLNATSGLPPLNEPTRRDGSNRKLWWWIGAGGALAITAATVLIIATRDDEPSKQTMISRPMVTFE